MSSYDCPASGWRSRQGPLDLGYVSLKVKSMQAFSLQKFDCLPNLAKHQTCQRVCSHMTLDMTKSNVSCCAGRNTAWKHQLAAVSDRNDIACQKACRLLDRVCPFCHPRS